ncbi:MAG: acyl carrier protein [Cyclobacteriaceae bacterium]|nr:acyl carrier protein [Cyclobacteriaceae bacterium]
MKTQEILNLIEETLELETGSLSVDTLLDSIEEYDSMGKLSIIVLSDDEFGKKLSGEQLRDFKSVGDIVSFLES